MTHIRKKQAIGAARADIEGKAPWVPKAIGEDFLAYATSVTDEWILGRYAIFTTFAIDAKGVDPQQFSQQIREVLRISQNAAGFRRTAPCMAGVVFIRAAAISGGNI